MSTVRIVFLILSTILSLSTLTYVGVDVALEKRRKTAVATSPTPIVPSVPTVAAIPKEIPVILPLDVEELDAEEADALISDDLALLTAKSERGAGQGPRATVNIGDIDKIFEANSIVTIDALKKYGLIPKKAGRIKILADGFLHKSFIVKAESFSVQAIKMIELMGGTVIILKD